ncbi:hypothetical protein WMY93_017710 [Mugilogobius chulae]|uniref:Coiled-coil domain-containing protein 93 n=1 Tax=Mugilogobius chulae TaxID=88201 RepID=A0AAW0NRR5_9GOBI
MCVVIKNASLCPGEQRSRADEIRRGNLKDNVRTQPYQRRAGFFSTSLTQTGRVNEEEGRERCVYEEREEKSDDYCLSTNKPKQKRLEPEAKEELGLSTLNDSHKQNRRASLPKPDPVRSQKLSMLGLGSTWMRDRWRNLRSHSGANRGETRCVLKQDTSPIAYMGLAKMAAATSVFHRVRTGSKIGVQYDQDGNIIQILELLLAAGYFRARIKGLSPFDKVVGGMTWCITTCNFDVDVDLLFQENSTIGQKIALTEKIVSVLPKMKCPHRLEPHQIQGLDFIHIYPVIQVRHVFNYSPQICYHHPFDLLCVPSAVVVKRAIETREEMGDYVRAYSISQFNKTHKLPEDVEFEQRKGKAVNTVLEVLDVYKPQRKYRRQRDAADLTDEESRVHSTLLEYGRRYGFSKQTKQDKVDGQKTIAGVSPSGADVSEEEEDLQEVEEMRIKSLMTNMAAMAIEEGRLTASAVGHIVGLQSEEIKQIASEYKEKQSELSSEELSERYGPLQQHRRAVASLQKQIQHKSKALEELQEKHQEVKTSCDEARKGLQR